jgi:DNA gyrase subunit A
MDAGERITAMVSVPSFEQANYCTLATARGKVKRVELSEFASVRPSGLIAMTLEHGDELGWARLTNGEDEILLVTQDGQALRFDEKDIRPMGRPAAGVNGIALKNNDRITSMEVVEPEGFLLVITEQGIGKKTPIKDYPARGRATGGVMTTDQHALDKTGKIAAARVVQEDDEIAVISSSGQTVRLKVSQISTSGRATRGVHLMNMQGGDAVASIARLPAEVS